MTAVGGTLGPLATGDIFCNAIDACRRLADYGRASEWTDAARRWCDQQGFLGFPGVCRVYRAGLLRLRGALADAAREATNACEELRPYAPNATGEAFYELGEIRLRLGELTAAEEAFRQAHEMGRDPQPGLALLRLAYCERERPRRMMRCRLMVGLATLVAVLTINPGQKASAFDADETFKRGSWLLSAEGGYGWQADVGSDRPFTGLEFANAGIRVGLLPFGPAGPGVLRGALELGLEPLYQRYTEPVDAFYAGLAAVVRYHFLSFGRLVPYIELAGAAGGTDLKVPEIDSNFSFLLIGGAGLSYFVADRVALYAGYRFQHVSNARTSTPNFGVNSNTGVVGVSYFFK